MARKRFTRLLLIITAIVVCGYVGMLIAGFDLCIRDGIHIINRRAPIGMLSPSGRYRLVELEDATGKYLLYSIIEVGETAPFTTIYVTTDFWYHSRYIRGARWAKNADDFFVVSSDTGPHFYRYEDGTWSSEWYISYKKDESGDFIPNEYIIATYLDGEFRFEPYDADNLPDIAKRH